MATPNSRTTFIQYCLRRLGHPVIEINVDPDQVEDRVDDALQQFQQFNSDAVEHIFYSYQIQASDITNRYLTVPDNMIAVTSFLPLQSSNTDSMFSVAYQTRLSEWDVWARGGSISNYTIMMQYLDLMDFEFDTQPRYQFNQHTHQVNPQWDWNTDVNPGDWVVMEGYQALDPNNVPDIWNDIWLKKYATELLRRQWGENLIKYKEVVLMGGAVLNGAQIYQMANDNIAKLEDDLQSTYQNPPAFFMG